MYRSIQNVNACEGASPQRAARSRCCLCLGSLHPRARIAIVGNRFFP